MRAIPILFLLAAATPAAAETPRVAFDLSGIAACRPVEPTDEETLSSDEKLIEAHLAITVRMHAGDEADLEEAVFEITSPARRLQVVGFDPRTRLASELAAPIDVTHTTENIRQLGAKLGGVVAAPGAPVGIEVTPGLHAGSTRRTTRTETSHLLAPQTPVVVSGTMQQGTGVFFKFTPSSQSSLEGIHQLTCRFAVPSEWRADWIEVRCRATAQVKKYWTRSREECGNQRLSVGLYLSGDHEARQAAEGLAVLQTTNAGPGVRPVACRADAVPDFLDHLVGCPRRKPPCSGPPPAALRAARQRLKELSGT